MISAAIEDIITTIHININKPIEDLKGLIGPISQTSQEFHGCLSNIQEKWEQLSLAYVWNGI